MTALLPAVPESRPAHGLPREAYFDAAWYEREQRELFARTWNFVGHVSELANATAYVTATIGGTPVVVLRDDAGEVRGFADSCPRCGAPVTPGAFGTYGESLRCARRGCRRRYELTFTALHPLAIGIVNGFVFAHLDPEARDSFNTWLAEWPAHAGDYPWNELVEIRRMRVTLRCNWKLYIENHIDWLHLWYLHDQSLRQYEHHEATYATTGLHWWSAETLRAGEDTFCPAGLRPIPGVGAAELRTLRATLLFPNLPISSRAALVTTYQVLPTGPDTCTLDLRYWGARGSVLTDDALDERLTVQRDEDGIACERMQLALHSPRFAVGPLAVEHERAIADFHANLGAFLA